MDKLITLHAIGKLCFLLLLACAASEGLQAESQPARQVPSARASSQLLQQVLENNPTALFGTNRQIILVSSATPQAVPVVIHTFEKNAGQWHTVFPAMSASGAKNGFAPFDEKKEGDGRAPSGIFDITTTFGYHPSIRTQMPYKHVTAGDFWIDDVASDQYNQWVRLAKGTPSVSHERMKRTDHLYEYGIIIEYNVNPTVRGKGSAIFIHLERAPGAPTIGCIATSAHNMLDLLAWLDPEKDPIIIMGTEHVLRSARLHSALAPK